MNSLEPAHGEVVPRGRGTDLAIFAVSVLIPVVIGLALLDGYAMLGVFGLILVIIPLFIVGASWRKKHGALVPDAPRAKQVIQLAVAAGLLGLLTVALV